MEIETLDACVSMYTKRQKTIGEGDAAVLYDYCQTVGIKKLAPVSVLEGEEPVASDVHLWVVKHAWDQFHYLQTWLVPRLIGQIRFVVDTDMAVYNWLLTPDSLLTENNCVEVQGRLEQVMRPMLWHRQCSYLLGAVHRPVMPGILVDTYSKSARRLVYEQPQRLAVAQRHRLLYCLSGHLPGIDTLTPGIFSA